MRVALVTTIPAPYRTQVWDDLAAAVGELWVYSCAANESDRIWSVDDATGRRFRHRVLAGWKLYLRRWEVPVYLNPTLIPELVRMRPDAIIVTGYQTPSFAAAIAYSRLRGIPLVVWQETHALSTRLRPGPLAAVRRFLLTRADAFVTVGTRSTEFLRDLGVPREAITQGFNSVDVDAFAAAVGRSPAGADGPVRFLFVGQLIERKGVRDLLTAFAALPSGSAELTIVGYGPLEEELRADVRRRDLPVEFAGATRSVADTVRWYAGADFVVMPSHREVWGLVLNEALATGTPVIASREAGATPDLVESAPVPVGLTFPAGDTSALAQALAEAVRRRSEFDRAAIAQWGRTFTPAAMADAIEAAVRAAIATRRRSRPGAARDRRPEW